MAMHDTRDTDDSAIPLGLRRFLKDRAFELSGLSLLALITVAGLALASWSTNDPSFNHATDAVPVNLLGYGGSVLADLLAQNLGLGALPFLFIPLVWVLRLLKHTTLTHLRMTLLNWVLATLSGAVLLSVFPVPEAWPLACGLGGQLGDIAGGAIGMAFTMFLKGLLLQGAVGAVALAAFVWSFTRAMGLGLGASLEGIASFAHLLRHAGGLFLRMIWNVSLAIAGMFSRHRDREVHSLATRASPRIMLADSNENDILARLAPGSGIMRGQGPVSVVLEDDDGEPETEMAVPVRKVLPKPAAKKKAPRDAFELPELGLLSEPKRPARAPEISRDALEANARNLEGVLDDFGVKGQIIDVKPGPVVTLYELEPAPGIKSSRVISLADDIARSMSAISARVAVVQGRNVIGIELPNAKRETVYLREMFSAENFLRSTGALTVALGKNIGGEPIYADLARMPHLLIAGTTGSGKSVGINTMILSLLYRLSPERCKLIMIDPKMLELSVYEGIPHLLSPVVTDPRKAVVALKWAVREMEERYKKMSKVGVRNIDGFNARVAQMIDKGEKLTRTVQTGFDAETGQPTFEQEEMETVAMPFIVVIIDEMADLMMVAGKDIEGAVQRLAQMARAAGIHVIMATQRPSVDVITGTIKANFPTRISFQVTSKIDSRTILGEQGAEQLLGQGDMLYMAGGGRISRLHGPFVSDSEVEAIVKHLKQQGAPDYLEAVTEERDEDDYGDPAAMVGGGSGDELYDQAVAVVLRDKKVSTSYVQRRLQVGYNKAASLIERMEKEGLISAANATGKREILVPGDSARD